MSDFSCPECKSKLSKKKKYLFCKKCNKKYEIIDKIPSFVSKELFQAEVEKKRMKRYLDYLEKNGWEEFSKMLEGENPSLNKYINSNLRTNVISVLSPKKYGSVLDIGCGYGSVSFGLASIFKKVYALDITFEKLKMIDLRGKEQKVKNIVPVHANANKPPFKKNSFDGIVMIGVLEWIGLFNEGDPKEIQLDFLKKMNSLLKPGGELLIGIENRWGIQYFMGAPDHNMVWGTNLMPRFLANIYSKIRGKGEYRTYTHSFGNYKKLMQEAGFKKTRMYSPLRSYRFPKYIIDLEDEKNWKYFFEKMFIPETKFGKIAKKIVPIIPKSMYKHFSPHFLIVGGK